MAKISYKERFYSSIGMFLHVLFVAGPLDFWYWIRSSLKSVNGRTVVITGGASGIGKRLAELLAIRFGAKVAILDINEHGAQETVDNIVRGGGIAHCWRCDISQVEEVNECARQIDLTFGNVDIVVCNAAILYIGGMLDLTTAQLQNSLDVNVMGTINTIRAFLRSMEQRNEGQIVAISSIAGFCGETNGIAYCTKFAIRGVMQCLQMEMKDKGLNGIRCTTVCPYFTRTPMILNLGMRPTSIWLPFMSVDRCACQIVDAILREKSIAFVPHYITMNDFFKSPHLMWWILVPVALLINFVSLFYFCLFGVSGKFLELLGVRFPSFFIATNLFALIAHLGESMYSLKLCNLLRISRNNTLKWMLQTFILGYPSLRILLSRNVMSRHR
uniref:BMA-DHS-29, isoform a n=1 Tax=Brugia malayi TaxID=6279 RepID=A0A1I9G492_BRUMA|nr:BMA-DHS-29, isoform a [Brugia malayi]